MDILMPKLDGYQTCALLRQNETWRNVPFVMLSSKDGLFDRARGQKAGCEADFGFHLRLRRVRERGRPIARIHLHHLNPLPANLGAVLGR